MYESQQKGEKKGTFCSFDKIKREEEIGIVGCGGGALNDSC